jgi:hypothetical protein
MCPGYSQSRLFDLERQEYEMGLRLTEQKVKQKMVELQPRGFKYIVSPLYYPPRYSVLVSRPTLLLRLSLCHVLTCSFIYSLHPGGHSTDDQVTASLSENLGQAGR